MQDDPLQQAIHEALQNYNKLEVLQHSPLYEVAALWSSPDTSDVLGGARKALAVRHLLERMVTRFQESSPHDALVIEKRYFEDKQIKELELLGLTAQTTFYKLVRRVLPTLALILTQMEEEVLAERQEEGFSRTAALPSPTYERLVGVDHYIKKIRRLLNASLDQPGLPIVVTGLGGIGKTSLVSEALRSWLRQDSPPIRKILFAPFEKFAEQSASHSLDQVLFRLGDQLALPLAALPTTERRLRQMYGHLAQDKYILVLDNIEREDEVEQAMQIADGLAPAVQMFITSRHTFEHRNVRSLVLGELPEACATELLELEAQRLGYAPPDEATIQQILGKVGGHPLALKLVAGQMRRLPVQKVLAQLEKPIGKTQEMFTGVYETSWNLLSPGSQSVLLGLMLLPQEGADWEWLQVGASADDKPMDEDQLTAALEELTTLNLVQVSREVARIYSLHRLTYRFLALKAGWDVEDVL